MKAFIRSIVSGFGMKIGSEAARVVTEKIKARKDDPKRLEDGRDEDEETPEAIEPEDAQGHPEEGSNSMLATPPKAKSDQ